jgi:hypothetical protein
MIGIKFDGTVETTDLVSAAVDVKTGAVTAIYRITEGAEQTYRTIAVPGIDATSFITAVVAGAKTQIAQKITKTEAEPITELP